jgi:hypothetical protein
MLGAIERYEVRRKHELLADLKLWDAALDSIITDLGEERRKSGLSFYAEMPTSMKSPRMLALQAGCNELSRWRNAALQEHAQLVV